MTRQFTWFDVNSTKILAEASLEADIPLNTFDRFHIHRKLHSRLGWTLAHVLAVRGCWEPVPTLLTIGMDPDKGDAFGWTARQLSEDLHGVDIFSGETCQSVIPLCCSDDFGMTETHILAISGKPMPLYHRVKGGDLFDQRDCFGNTPMDYVESLHGDGSLYKRLIAIQEEL